MTTMNAIQVPADGGKLINVLGIPIIIRIAGRAVASNRQAS